MTEKLISTYRPAVNAPHPIQEIVFKPSSGGLFEVTVDGDLIYSKAATGEHADIDTLVAEVGKRLPAP